MEERPAPRRAPRPTRATPAAGNITDLWAASLRTQAHKDGHIAPPGVTPGRRPPGLRGGSSGLGAGEPGRTSPAPSTIPSSHHSPHRNASLHSDDRRHHANGNGPQTLPSTHLSSHRDQQERMYPEARYDAEFDRSRTGPPASTVPPARGLFNPHTAGPGPSSAAAEVQRRREREEATMRRNRSKRDVVDAADVGGRMRGSKESLDSEDSGRPSSRSSKEGRHRRRKEGERDGRRPEGDTAGTGSVVHDRTKPAPPSAHQQPGQHPNSSRQLFDPRRDDPVRFSGSSLSRKPGTPSILSVASSTHSVASTSGLSMSEDTLPSKDAGNAGGRQEINPIVAQLRRAYRDITDLEAKLQEEHKAAFLVATREEEVAQGLRQKEDVKKYDDEYWVKLATGHKQLADAHYAFLQIALDPRLPPSLHSLAQKYNIPTRLWQTAFHQLLERMRHAVVTPTSSTSLNATTDEPINILEHLIEFIQYAYGHYSQLFEDPSVASFRSAWIEQLGDLARYRMAVAGLASRVSAAQSRTKRSSTVFNVEKEREARPIDAASIGDAALGDWDVEEQESWRVMARDWYGQGITETPGSGRLHHHLALLSKGDELRGLYHYCKSLCASHPYHSAKESILPLFEDEHQARRTQPDVSKAELFVHLHGMLFTRIALDDFDDCLERFLERLREEACLIRREGGNWASETLGSGAAAPFGDAEWFMIAVINISALLQYGAEDGVLKTSVARATTDPASRAEAGRATPKSKPPQAIMLNPSSHKRSEMPDDDGDDESRGPEVKPLAAEPQSEDPLAFRLAQRLTFSILDLMLQHPTRLVGTSHIVNPYIVLVLTFVSHLAQYPGAMHHLQRAIPWTRLASFYNAIPITIEIRMDTPTKLVCPALPEDWCVRGMDWTGRQLFGRGHWKGQSSARHDEMPPIGPTSSVSLESEMEALRLDLETIDEYGEGDEAPSVQLAADRWRRVATTAAWLVRNVPGLDYHARGAGKGKRFVIVSHLDSQLRRWRVEEQQAAEAERLSRISALREEVDEVEGEESEEDEDDPSDSPAVQELKARRRQLKAVIKQARLATRTPQSSIRRLAGSKQKLKQPSLTVFPGFTVLVFDTNILLTSMKLFTSLIDAQTWTIVVPLAVVTELDGLRKNPGPLGAAADVAVTYLESAVRSAARYFKVQTSRGNYLKDLAIRSENIDFAGDLALGTAFSHDLARNMDDVILKAVAWQRDHFVSRLAMVNPRADRRLVPVQSSKVVLVTFDRNLRLKARARGIDAVDEKGMTLLLENG